MGSAYLGNLRVKMRGRGGVGYHICHQNNFSKHKLLSNSVMVMDQTSVEKKVDVSSTFIENIFRSGLTLVSSNDIITIKIDIKIC